MTDGTPFPLTPVQHAYLTGRMPGQVLGGVGCHLYQEFEGHGLTAQRLEGAITLLLQRHPMLHIAFRADGQQYYQKQPYWHGVTVHDLRQSDSPSRDAYLYALRQRLSHRLLRVDIGETFDFQLTLLPEGNHRLHVSIDLLIMDASSFTLFFDELNALLAGESLAPVDVHYDFRSWILQQQQVNQGAIEQARCYWLAKAENLPPAPILPLACEPATVSEVRTTRRRMTLPAERWACFSQQAGDIGVTPTMVLTTCFSAVLARWGGLSRLLLNLTLFDRQPLHPAVDNMLADFTNIILLDTVCYGGTLGNLAFKNQLTFTEDWEHRHWSGVELLRELKRQQRYPHGAPVVFTSNLGRSLYSRHAQSPLGDPAWGISQTPQVWIDHLVFEHQGEIYLQWDSNEALFPPALIETLFETYCALINQLCSDSSAWSRPFDELMPPSQQAVRLQVNSTTVPLPEGLLHEGIFRMSLQQPQALAVIDSRYQWCYGELAEKARRCAAYLTEHGVQPGDNVAVTMSKGAGQIVSILGVLLCGAIYVPVSLDQPTSRRKRIYADANIQRVLVCQHDNLSQTNDVLTLSWQQAIKAEPLAITLSREPTQPAYIIYTSGSTGTPKGVVISHRAALNTCADINRRYQVNPHDRVLALSALHFDLSVYDIFGVLTAGGALVIAAENQRRDPRAWCELIEDYQVTLWNSVPALFNMLLTWCEGVSCSAPANLRAVMISGDWIVLDLPERYRAFRPQGQFIAMGGATEAAIWSNACDIEHVPAHWRSIPYGYPLANQRYRVVDELGRDCPDWVVGELWIGGAGVAEGYFNDPQRSTRQFLMQSGERWYRTGDMGCYWPDGTLEFFGRRDKQVKVGGYRIELGEIESALSQIDGVKQAVVMAVGEKDKTLVAFVVPQGDKLSVAHHCHPALPDNWQTLLPASSHPVFQGDDAEEQVADFLLHRLLMLEPGQFLSDDPASLMQERGIQPRWRSVVDRWLAFLIKQQRLQSVASGYRVCGGERSYCANALLEAHQMTLAQILSGEHDPLTLLGDPVWAPEHLALCHPASSFFISELAQVCHQLAHRLQRPVRLLEIGSRSAVAAGQLLSQLNAEQIEYVALEHAKEWVLQAQQRLSPWPCARVLLWSPDSLSMLSHHADIIWVNNALHRLIPDDRHILATLHQLAAPGALIYVTEFRQLTPLALLSTLLLTDGDPQDLLHPHQRWITWFDEASLTCQYHDDQAGLQRFLLRAPDIQQRPDARKLQIALSEPLPAWMVPQRLVFLDALPLTANGKIDYQSLILRHRPKTSGEADAELPQGEVEEHLASLWQALLSITSIQRDTDFFQQGGDSLLATRLIAKLHQAGFKAQLSELFNHPTLADFAATLGKTNIPADQTIVSNPKERFQPFALTEIQQAYLVGRQSGFTLGGVGSHFFVEFAVEQLNVARLERVWNRLIARHDMLRAVVRDGRQQVLEHTPPYVIPIHTICTPQEALALREQLAHQVIDPTCWPVFDLQVALSEGAPARLWLCLDNLLLDGLSMQILLAELEHGYRYPEQQRPPLPVTFRDYLQHPSLKSPHADSLAWWRDQLASIPPAPALPLRCAPQDIETPRFVRLSSALDKSQWQSLKTLAANARLTPSAVLLAAWATVLSAWSARPDFTLNLTLFDRRPLHPQINQVLGDFTSLMLLAWHPADNWLHSAQQLQQRLSQNLNHRDISALWVMRQLAQQQNQPATPMPVVFTSALGFEQDNFLAHRNLLDPVWGISQTPQVWLDHQVYESEGELRFNWDFVEALFPPTQLETQFAQYHALLKRLSQDELSWHAPLTTLIPPVAHRGIFPVEPKSNRVCTSHSQPVSGKSAIGLICDHFREVVGQSIAVQQNFFEAGATSLNLVQLHIQLQRHAFPTLRLLDLFTHSSPVALIHWLFGPTMQEKTQHTRPIRRRQRRMHREQNA